MVSFSHSVDYKKFSPTLKNADPTLGQKCTNPNIGLKNVM